MCLCRDPALTEMMELNGRDVRSGLFVWRAGDVMIGKGVQREGSARRRYVLPEVQVLSGGAVESVRLRACCCRFQSRRGRSSGLSAVFDR